jgi:hypothetical protein
VVSFFAALLTARPPGAPATGAAPEGRPVAATDGQPAAAGSTPAPARSPLTDAEVSFDDFFGTAEAGRTPKGDSDPGKEDLDQFQSWLQNLKR